MTRLLLGLLFLSFALAQKVTVEFDHSADFSRYKTFAIRDGQLRTKNPALDNDIVKKRIESEIAKRLTDKGLMPSTGRADLAVRYSLATALRRRAGTFVGPRGGVRRVGESYLEGTLVIDLRDPAGKTLIWRAVAVEDQDDPSKMADKLDDMVKKSIDKYPR